MSDEYDVRRVAGRRYEKNQDYYLIEWEGYPKEDSTWECRKNLLGNDFLIERFLAAYKRQNPTANTKTKNKILLRDAHDADPDFSANEATEDDSSAIASPPSLCALETTGSITSTNTVTLRRQSGLVEGIKKKRRTEVPRVVPAIDLPAVYGHKSIRQVVETAKELEAIKNSFLASNLKAKRQNHSLIKLEDGKMIFKGVSPPVYVVNEKDGIPFPEIFVYIDNLFRSSNVPPPDPAFLYGCTCTSKCTSKQVNRFCHEEPAYRSDGILRSNHRGAIYECNSKCTCDPNNCPNRMVQRGRKVALEIFKTERKGWGVRSVSAIKKNSFVEEYLGEVITEEEGMLRGRFYDKIGLSYLFDMDLGGNEGYQKYVIDSYVCGNASHFFNHSCNPNLAVYGVFYDSMDPSFHRLAFFAQKDIAAGEELTFDYTGSSDDTETDLSRKFPCYCESTKCRNWIHR